MTRLPSSLSVFFLHSRTFRLFSILLHRRRLAQSATPGDLPLGWTASSLEEAKRWISDYRRAKSVSKQHVDVSFARSSGPGGQHVNKTNSKAIVKLSIDASFIPQWARETLRKSPAFIESSACLQTSSTTSRSQGDNLDECLRKLHSIILEAASQSIPSLPSEQQQEHVKSLQRKEQARRKDEKIKRNSIKSGRNAKWGD